MGTFWGVTHSRRQRVLLVGGTSWCCSKGMLVTVAAVQALGFILWAPPSPSAWLELRHTYDTAVPAGDRTGVRWDMSPRWDMSLRQRGGEWAGGGGPGGSGRGQGPFSIPEAERQSRARSVWGMCPLQPNGPGDVPPQALHSCGAGRVQALPSLRFPALFWMGISTCAGAGRLRGAWLESWSRPLCPCWA